jgi:hypothetical protein
MSKKQPTTILTAKPAEITAEETEEQLQKWFSNKTIEILKICDSRKDLAKDFCDQIATHFGPDDELGPLLSETVKKYRVNKPKGRPKRTDVDDYVLLNEYAAFLQDGREKALDFCSRKHKITIRTVENRVSLAKQKAVNGELFMELDDFTKEMLGIK